MNNVYDHAIFLEKNLNFFNIVAPIGGFGNHIRWLLLLDPLYKFIMIQEYHLAQKYSDLKGPSWPSYEQYLDADWSNVLPEIKIEIIKSMEDDCILLDNLEKKINFIKTNIYHESRTWSNWLYYEWKYRKATNTVINFVHTIDSVNCKNIKTLALVVDPELAYHCYVKFNNNLNNTLYSDFILKIKTDNTNAINEAKKNSNIKIFDANIVYQPTLDRTFYKELIEYCGMSDLYFEANAIHQLWYSAQKRSEKEFVRDITALYK